jgi:hypothetical protein
METLMRKFSIVAAVFAVVVVGAWLSPPAAQADSLSCSSVNGMTRCTGSDGLDCHTVEGHMVCAPGSKGSCETVGETTTCRNGSVMQTLRTGPADPDETDDQDRLDQGPSHHDRNKD